MMKRVLFVCMGNICRSAAAEAVLRRYGDEFGVEIEVDSAGTHGYHVGKRADSRMRAAAASRGYEITSRARQVTRTDLEPGRFDLVLAMDAENFSALTQLAELAPKLDPKQRLHIRMFSDYLDDSWPRNVPDPYYGEIDGFMTVLDMLEEGCPVILQTLSGKEVLDDELAE